MSSINIIIDQQTDDNISIETKDKWLTSIIQLSAKLLTKNESEIIIKLEKYQQNETINMPDILIRAETSVSRRHLIKEWGRILLDATNRIITEKATRVAVKTYVLDSEWTEYTPPEKTS